MELIIVGMIVFFAAGYLLYLGIRTFRNSKEGCQADCGCSIKEKR